DARRAHHAAALASRDRLHRVAVRVAAALLHLHEHERVAVGRDDVDLYATAAVVPHQDPEPLAEQVLAGELLARLAAVRAARQRAQCLRFQRVPWGVSSSTTPSASSFARAASARANSRALRACWRSSKSACSSADRRSSAPPGSSTPKMPSIAPISAFTRTAPARVKAPSAIRLFARRTRPWRAARASGVLRSSISAPSKAG